MNNWKKFENKDFDLEFLYPQTTPQGHQVLINENRNNETDVRYHLITPDSDEVYFEVGRYQNLTAETGYAGMKAELANRFPNVQISDLQEVEFAGQAAHTFSVVWPERERKMVFIPYEDILYRIIYNPRSSLNIQIAETLQFL